MSDLGYFLIVFVFLIIGIAKVENKYDRKFSDIHNRLDELENEISELKDQHLDLDSRIDDLEQLNTELE